MGEVAQALGEVKVLYEKIFGKPAPEIPKGSFAAFPPGVDPVRHAVQEVEQLKQLFERMSTAPSPATWTPQADTFATQDALVFRVEIPGVRRDDVKVFVSGGECVVRGERKAPESTTESRPVSIERPWGPFERRFALPPGSRPDRVNAEVREGLLEVRVAVEAKAEVKETEVEVA